VSSILNTVFFYVRIRAEDRALRELAG